MKKTVVLFPGLSVSHFVPMLQLADALLEAGYAVTVALIDPSLKGDIALAAVIDRVSCSKPSVVFHKLPRIQETRTLPPLSTTKISSSGTWSSWRAITVTCTTSSSPWLLAAFTA